MVGCGENPTMSQRHPTCRFRCLKRWVNEQVGSEWKTYGGCESWLLFEIGSGQLR